MDTRALIIFTATLGAIAGLGMLLFWLGLFASSPKTPFQPAPAAEQSPDLLTRLRIRYENADLDLSFNGFVLVCTALAVFVLTSGVLLGLIFFAIPIAVFGPFLAYQILVTRREDKINKKREQLIYFIRDYADTLRVFRNPQQTNIELASRADVSADNFFYGLIQEANQSVAQGTSFIESMLALRTRFNSAIWQQFIQLVVGTAERGVPISEALRALALHAERQFKLLNRINVYRKAENTDANLMFLISIITVVFVSRSDFVTQYVNSPIVAIVQVVSACISILAWILVRWIGQSGIYADTANRIAFKKEDARKFKQFEVGDDNAIPRFVMDEQRP